MDTTSHNLFISIMVIAAIVVVIAIFGQGYGSGSPFMYRSQPASAYSAGMMDVRIAQPQYHTQSVTAYSRPSTQVQSSYTSDYYSQQTVSYTCTADYRECWTNQ